MDKQIGCIHLFFFLRSFTNTLTHFRCDNVGQRMMLGFGGVLAAGLAIAASFGFCSAVGVEFVSIVGVVPFLVIGRYVVHGIREVH